MSDHINSSKIQSVDIEAQNYTINGEDIGKGILPKLPKSFIQYIKKPAVVAAQELEITEDEIKDEAMFLECSKREIRNLILEIQKDLNTDYAKRS